MEEKEIYIYGLVDPTTNKIRYVGKTDNLVRRFKSHISECTKQNTYKNRWLYGLITKNLQPKIIILEKCNNHNWQEREKYHIEITPNLTNLTLGGEGTSTGQYNHFYGKHHSTETKLLLSRASKQYCMEHGNPFKNKTHSIETKEKLSQIGKQRWKNGNLHLPPVMCGKDNPSSKCRKFISPDGVEYVVYTLRKFCNQMGLSVNVIEKNINKGKIVAPTDKNIIGRQRKKSIATIGWEVFDYVECLQIKPI